MSYMNSNLARCQLTFFLGCVHVCIFAVFLFLAFCFLLRFCTGVRLSLSLSPVLVVASCGDLLTVVE